MNLRPIQRLVMIDLGGIGESLLDALTQRELLPNLARLLAGSVRGPLRSPFMPNPHVAGMTAMTGLSPRHHFIYDSEYLDPVTATIRQVTPGRSQGKHLWAMLEVAERKVISLGSPQGPAFQPREKSRDGMGFHWLRRPKSTLELTRNAAKQTAHLEHLADSAQSLTVQGDWSLLHVRFANNVELQTFFWPELEMDESVAVAKPDWISHIHRILQSLDDCIGQLLELAARLGAGVMLLADHSYGRCRGQVNVNGILRIHGIQRRPGLGTVVSHKGRGLSQAIYRQLQSGRSSKASRSLYSTVSCDWSCSLAHAPFGQHSGLIYLTEKARRQEGRAERATREVAEIFRLIADPETGQPVFAEVIPVADRWQIDPAASGWPDMIAIPSEGYEPRADWPYKEKVRILENDTSCFTAASSSGFMALSGPGADPQQPLRGMLQDVVPTVLKWLDLPMPEYTEGHAFGTPSETQIYQPHIRPSSPRTVVLNSRMTSNIFSPLS